MTPNEGQQLAIESRDRELPDNHWNRVYTDPDYFGEFAKRPAIQTGASLSPFPETYAKRQANIAYLSSSLEIPAEEMPAIYEAKKNEIGKTALQTPTLSDEGLFNYFKKQFDRENEVNTAADGIYQEVQKSVFQGLFDSQAGTDITGQPTYRPLLEQKLTEAGEILSDEDRLRIRENADKMADNLRRANDSIGDEARWLFDIVSKQTGRGQEYELAGEQPNPAGTVGGLGPVMNLAVKQPEAAPAGEVDLNDPEMLNFQTEQILEKFADMPTERRQSIYLLAGAFAELNQVNKGVFYQAAETLGRFLTREMGERISRNFTEESIRGQQRLLQSDLPLYEATNLDGSKGLSQAPTSGQAPITAEQREKLKADAARKLKILQIKRELVNLADTQIDPIKVVTDWPTWEQGFYGFVGSIPYAGIAAIPFVGFPAITASFFGQYKDDLLLEYPDMDPDQAAAISALAAPMAAGLELIQANLVMGRFVSLDRAIKFFLKPSRNPMTRIIARGTATFGLETGIELSQNRVLPILQTLGAALSDDIPDYDWRKDIEAFDEELGVTAVTMLLFTLTGLPFITSQEIGRNAAYLQDKKMLKYFGMSEEQADRVSTALTKKERVTAFKEAEAARDPALIEAGRRQLFVDTMAQLQEPADPFQPSIRRDGDRFTVLDAEGNTIADRVDVDTAFYEFERIAGSSETLFASVQGELINALLEAGQATNPEGFSEQIDVATQEVINRYNNMTPEQLQRRIAQWERETGQTWQPGAAVNITAVNTLEQVKEGLFQSITRVVKAKSPEEIRAVLEDRAEGQYKIALESGQFTEADMVGWIREYESGTGDSLLEEDFTSRDVVEAVSTMSVAYYSGNLDNARVSSRLRAFFEALKEYFAAIFARGIRIKEAIAAGQIAPEFEAFLAQSVGLDIDRQIGVQAAQQAVSTINGAGLVESSFAISPQQDADYLAAVERGDMKKAQRMVDKAARSKGYDSDLLYHGTTHDFTVFSTERSNDGNDMGKGFYFTSNPKDAKKNYAGEGPDLTSRIERRQEQILDELESINLRDSLREFLEQKGIDKDLVKGGLGYASEGEKKLAAKTLAKKELSGGKPKILKTYVRLANPAILGGENPTRLEYNYEEDTEKESGSAVRFIESIRVVLDRFFDTDVDKAIESITQNGELDGMALDVAVELLQTSDGIQYATDEVGDLASGEVVRQILEESGYDGIVDNTVNNKFGSKKRVGKPMAGMDVDTYHVIAFDSSQIKSADPVTRDDQGNVIPLSRRFDPSNADISFSVSVNVAPVRTDRLDKMTKGEVMKRAKSPKFIHLQQIVTEVASAYGVSISARFPVIGGWTEDGQPSLEVPEAIVFETDDLAMATEMAALIAISAPELQNAAFVWKYDENGQDTEYRFQAKSAETALEVAQDLEAGGVQGFSYDPKTREFSIVAVGKNATFDQQLYDFIKDHTEQGRIGSRGNVKTAVGTAQFPGEADYRQAVASARVRSGAAGAERGEALRAVADRAERRLDRSEAAKQTAAKAKSVLQSLAQPRMAASRIETELKGRQFDNIRAFGLWLDERFRRQVKKSSFDIGSKDGLENASNALVYDVLDGLSTDGSGMGWYDERVQETLRELAALHPEFNDDPYALAVYIGILAATSQGYTVMQNFQQADRVYADFKREGKIPKGYKFAQSSPAINGNLQLIQQLIDQYGLNGYAEFMDSEVTGRAIRDQYGLAAAGVTLAQVTRGNAVMGQKIGSFFNNLRGRFDTITMDLWYTRTMHRYLGETLVPLNTPKLQAAIKKLRAELKKPEVRTYGVDVEKAMQDDEYAVQAGMRIMQKWGAGKNKYSEAGYFKFPDGYAVEKAARRINALGGMKGAPQNKSHRNYFADIVRASKAKLDAMGIVLTEADIQAIIWYREKNLFASVGRANIAAKPADYLDAAMGLKKTRGADATFAISPASYYGDLESAVAALDSNPAFRRERVAAVLSKFKRIKEQFANKADLEPLSMPEAVAQLEAIITLLPPDAQSEVGGFRRLLSFATAKGRLNYLTDRIAKADAALEKYLRTELQEDIMDLLERAIPKRGENKVQTSSLGPDAQRVANLAIAAIELGTDETSNTMAEIEAALASPDIDADRQEQLLEQWGVLNALGDFFNRSALELDQARAFLRQTFGAGRAMWRMQQEARRKQYRDMAEELAGGLKKATENQIDKMDKENPWLKNPRQFVLSHYSFMQLLRSVLPKAGFLETWERSIRQAEIGSSRYRMDAAKRFIDTLMAASGKKTSFGVGRLMYNMRKTRKASVRYKEGYNEKLIRLPMETAANILEGRASAKAFKLNAEAVAKMSEAYLAVPIMRRRTTPSGAVRETPNRQQFLEFYVRQSEGTDDKLNMSPAEAMQLLLAWDQSEVQARMRRQGWTDESIEDMQKMVTSVPGGEATMDFLRREYKAGGDAADPVYMKMFGMAMPRIENYAPTRYRHKDDSNDLSPMGSALELAGTTPGSLKARQRHDARMRRTDAITVFFQHAAQMGHWIHFAEINREIRGVLKNQNVRESMEATLGRSGLQIFDQWMDTLAQGGGRRAMELSADKDIWAALISGKSIASLGFSVRTLFMQIDAANRAALDMGLAEYTKTVLDPRWMADMPKAWNSDTVQRRLIEGSRPEVRYVFERAAVRPSMLLWAAQKSMIPMQMTDAALTSFTAAIVYRNAYNKAKKAEASDAMAEQAALDAMDKAVFNYSQPIDITSRSLREVQGNMLQKVYMMFLSDARLKTALFAEAIGQLGKEGERGKGASTISALMIMAVVTQTMANLYRDWFSDEPDDEIWTLEGYAMAMMLAPLSGYMLVGTVGSTVVREAFGEMTFQSTDPANEMIDRGIRSIKGWDNTFNTSDPEAMLKQWNNLLRFASFNPTLAAPAALLNFAKPIVGAMENAENPE